MTDQGDRVRSHSSAAVNARIDRETLRRVQRYANRDGPELARRIQRLQREWDLERALQANAAVLAMTGLALGTRDRRWLALPALVAGFLLMHAVQGWCPPVPLLRRLGFRTRREIETERYAIKALRGDFQSVRPRSAAQAWRAVRS